MQDLVFVVRPSRVDLYDALSKVFSHEPGVRVVLDRRSLDRRQQDMPHSAERRRADRRLRALADLELKGRGWTLIRVPSDRSR